MKRRDFLKTMAALPALLLPGFFPKKHPKKLGAAMIIGNADPTHPIHWNPGVAVDRARFMSDENYRQTILAERMSRKQSMDEYLETEMLFFSEVDPNDCFSKK